MKDSELFTVDESVTCLVGKNESGKTALLQALNKLNPAIAEHGNFEGLDYPATEWTEYKRRKDKDPAPALDTTWRLEAPDVDALRPVLGDSIDYEGEFIVSKGYSNARLWSVRVDEPKLIRHLLDRHELLEDERETLGSSTKLAELSAKLAGLKSPTNHQKELLAFVEREFPGNDPGAAARRILEARLPRFVYFSEYLRLPGRVSITDLKSRIANPSQLRDSDRAFLAYLSLIGATAANLESAKEFERLTRELEAASNHLTAKMRKYWSQNRYLRVKCHFDMALPGDPAPFNAGHVARTRIENTRHGVTTSFDERSAGFVWFFSFLVWFSQVKKEYGDNLVILLDEPGLTLHAKAQSDLLRYIENELAPDHQVIYTTHSPFMIDAENLLRARTVEDVFIEADSGRGVEEQDLGTKVGDDILSTDRDTVFPLQACLGYEITQTLFVGKHTLLVEGPSDLAYLKWFSRRLAAAGRTSLDRRWTICPCGGITKVPAFLSLFGGNKLHVAVLTDFTAGDKSKVEQLRRSELLAAGHVLSADVYAGMAEADVEDLLGVAGYVDLANRALGLDAGESIGRPSAGCRIVKWIEDQARMLGPQVPEFDHFLPASFLMEQGTGFTLVGETDALDRFERLFIDLNRLLPDESESRPRPQPRSRASVSSASSSA